MSKIGDVHDEDFETMVYEIWEADIARFVSENGSGFALTACPACESDQATFFCEARGFSHQRCVVCNTLYVSPCPSDETIVSYIASAPNYKFWHERMPTGIRASRTKLYAERASYVISNLKSKSKVSLIEFGAGRGEMAIHLDASGIFERITLIDPQPIDLDLVAVESISSGFDTAIDRDAYDVAVAFEVLEHIVDPSQLLRSARNSLKKGGLLMLSTPNGASYEVDRLGAKSNQVPFEHVRLYNPSSLKVLLRRFGFEIVQIETPGLFDVDLIQRKMNASAFDYSKDDALQFIMHWSDTRERFQEFLQAKLRSSHMRCIARAI